MKYVVLFAWLFVSVALAQTTGSLSTTSDVSSSTTSGGTFGTSGMTTFSSTSTSGGNFCGQVECQANEFCMSTRSSEPLCVDYTTVQQICYSCNYSNYESCYAVAGTPNTAQCECSNAGTIPDCSGMGCGYNPSTGSYLMYCKQSETCQYDSSGNAFCVNPDAYYAACQPCFNAGQRCNVLSTEPFQAECACNYGGVFPDCTGVSCGNSYCPDSSYMCLSTRTGNSKCVTYQDYYSGCMNCYGNGLYGCYATETEPANATCQCQYEGVFPDCSGYACGSSYCKSSEQCMSTYVNGQYEQLCVNSTLVQEVCSNCNYQKEHCEVVPGNPNTVVCACNWGGTPGACTGMPCGNGFCDTNQVCMYDYRDYNNQISACVDSEEASQCYRVCYQQGGWSSTCVPVQTSPGVYNASCECQFAKVNGTCTGPPCGTGKYCKMDENCLPNAQSGARPVCVRQDKMFCNGCTMEQQCMGVVGTPDNFAECKCLRTSPSNPNVCAPVVCSGQYCAEPNMACVEVGLPGNYECQCTGGFRMSPLTRRCEAEPILGTCVPCVPDPASGAVPANCGCPAGQVCEQTSSSSVGRCVCAPDYVTNVDNITRIYCSPIKPNPATAGASCIAYGDPHFKTFDKRIYDFQNRCDYVLVNSSSLIVHIRHGECSPSSPVSAVSCTVGVAFSFKNEITQFFDDQALLNGNQITFPSTSSSGTQYSSLGMGQYIAQLSDGTVIEFQRFTVKVTVPAFYSGSTRGLCGTFDGLQGNDFTSRSGTLMTDVYAFGENWKVGTNDPQLFSTAATCSQPARQDPYNFCSQITDYELLSQIYSACEFPQELFNCSKYFDLAKVYAYCIYDACTIGNVTTNHVAMWMEECQKEKQRQNQTCLSGCPTGQICAALSNGTVGCISTPCTCPSPSTQNCVSAFTSTGRVDRCICKPGYKLDNAGACVDVNLCGGVYCNNTNEVCAPLQTSTGQVFESCVCVNGTTRNLQTALCESVTNSTVLGGCIPCNDNNAGACGCPLDHQLCVPSRDPNKPIGRCECEEGYTFNANTQQCEEVIVIPVPTPSMCQAFGDPHYSTLDGKYLDDQVKCDSLLFQTNNITVHVRQSECWPNSGSPRTVACAKAIAVSTPDGHVIEINDDAADWSSGNEPSIFIDGVLTTVTGTVAVGAASVSKSSSWGPYSINLGNGVEIEYRRYFSVAVQVPASYRNSTTGICGNFNGNAADDEFPQGLYSVGNSTLFTTSNAYCHPRNKREVTATPATDPNCELRAAQDCGRLLKLGDQYPNCSALVDLVTFYTACLFDYCSLGDQSPFIVNASIEAAVSRCSFQSLVYSQYINNEPFTTGTTTTEAMSTSTSTGSSTNGGTSTNGSTSSGGVTGPTSGTTGDSNSSGQTNGAATAVASFFLLAVALIIAF